ncbi:MAG: hypothetical protein ACRBI6_18000 [Acidimicrobiales bacterium]
MSFVVVLLGLGVLAAVGAGIYLAGAKAVKRSADRSLQIVPGVELDVPANWYGSHEAEARLHRRLRDAVASVRSAAASDASLAVTLGQLEEHALRLDRHLINIARLPASTRQPQVAEATRAVETFEELTAQTITGATSFAVDSSTSDLTRLTEELGALEAARQEVEEIDRRQRGEA